MGIHPGSAARLLPGAPFLTFVQSLILTSNVLGSLVTPVTVWTQGRFSLSKRMQRKTMETFSLSQRIHSPWRKVFP